MKYYMVFVKHISKDDTEARECLSMTELLTAKSTAYSKMASAMQDTNCDYAFTKVMNSLGQDLIQPISFERVTETTETEAAAE